MPNLDTHQGQYELLQFVPLHEFDPDMDTGNPSPAIHIYVRRNIYHLYVVDITGDTTASYQKDTFASAIKKAGELMMETKTKYTIERG